MPKIPDSLRSLLEEGSYATVVTIDPDGTPHVTLAQAGVDGDEIVMASFFNLDQPKIRNMRRDPRVVVSLIAKENPNPAGGLHPYAVIQGRARITVGGALEVMDRLAEHYIGPGERFPLRDVPDGLVVHVEVERIYGQGPWRDAA